MAHSRTLPPVAMNYDDEQRWKAFDDKVETELKRPWDHGVYGREREKKTHDYYFDSIQADRAAIFALVRSETHHHESFWLERLNDDSRARLLSAMDAFVEFDEFENNDKLREEEVKLHSAILQVLKERRIRSYELDLNLCGAGHDHDRNRLRTEAHGFHYSVPPRDVDHPQAEARIPSRRASNASTLVNDDSLARLSPTNRQRALAVPVLRRAL